MSFKSLKKRGKSNDPNLVFGPNNFQKSGLSSSLTSKSFKKMTTDELTPAQIPAKREAESSSGADQMVATPDAKRIQLEKPSSVESASDVPETAQECKQETSASPARDNGSSSIQIRVMNLDKFMDQKGFSKLLESSNIACLKFKKVPRKDFAFIHFEVWHSL
jgi:hypothetical protein